MQKPRALRVRSMGVIALSMAVVVGTAAPPSMAAPATAVGTVLPAPAGKAVDDSYIVVLKPQAVSRSAVSATANRLAAAQRGRVGRVYSTALNGFEVTMDEASARKLAADPAVAYVEQNSVMSVQDVQPFPLPWNLDRIDDRTYQTNRSYTYPTYASDVTVYVIDTGIQATHADFFWFRVTEGVSLIPDQYANQDCAGHGTHVGGIIGGTTYGVAKGVTLVPIRVTDCTGNTNAATVLQAVDWVTGQHQAGERAVVNVSLTGGPTQAVDDAVVWSMADGLVYTVAAGNFSGDVRDACSVSPSRVPGVVTVGGMSKSDTLAGFTGVGACVDVYAPGEEIVSASNVFDWDSAMKSGTSMAAAHAAGVAAMLWSLHPSLDAASITRLVRQTAFHGAGWNPHSKPDPALYVQQIVPVPLPAVRSAAALPQVGPLQLSAAGGVAPYLWSATGLPPGVSLTPAGLLSGRIVPGGAFTVTVTATDATGRTGTVTETWTSRSVCLTPAAADKFC